MQYKTFIVFRQKYVLASILWLELPIHLLDKYIVHNWNARYYRLNVCISLKFLCWNLNHNAKVLGACGKQLDHEVDSSWMGAVPVWRKICELACYLSAMWEYNGKLTVFKLGT
jgi:hypothetical protein